MNTLKEVNYYGGEDNYIHLKFGDCVKAYNFTNDFREKYPQFVKAYEMYLNDNTRAFKNAFQVVNYVKNNNIPIHFYFNFTDTPAQNIDEVLEYLMRENDVATLYEHQLTS